MVGFCFLRISVLLEGLRTRTGLEMVGEEWEAVGGGCVATSLPFTRRSAAWCARLGSLAAGLGKRRWELMEEAVWTSRRVISVGTSSEGALVDDDCCSRTSSGG